MSAFVWTDERVRRALGLRLQHAEEGVEYAGVSTDSRTVEEGDLYVALVGERYDGHDFVADALSRGALGAVVSQPAAGDPANVRLYPVDDTLVALGRLAHHRRQALSVPVVGITGSSGKTTTKDMAAAALSSTLRVHATKANLNNRIGMPLTVLSVPEDAEALVLEMGTNEPGEIATLAQIARPDVAVITTVGESHLEKLGSLEGVMEEKLQILRHMADAGRCVVGDEPPALPERARKICDRVRVVGWSERADEGSRPEHPDVDVFGKYAFDWRGQRVTAPMVGKHGVTNALLALTVAELLGVSPRDAVRGLAATEHRALRTEFRRIGDLTLIVDCYNANPQSVRASLDVLEAQGVAARKVAVLGSMLELGDASSRLHREVLTDALARDVDLVAATGAFAQAASELSDPRLLTGNEWADAYPRLRERLEGDEIILLKASRGVALEGILPLLEGDFGVAESDGQEVG
ncbi:MAG: UDP-N-acetylmuramoyl-tripeptide--D-alanyl-D-alanine ligase [Longimicrobiales bacterium]|nr:UDP-N-acetylmuramoyl-tripeptide--D-alanyl-D-alanine ligase [Longimicrobiales bacterium]